MANLPPPPVPMAPTTLEELENPRPQPVAPPPKEYRGTIIPMTLSPEGEYSKSAPTLLSDIPDRFMKGTEALRDPKWYEKVMLNPDAALRVTDMAMDVAGTAYTGGLMAGAGRTGGLRMFVGPSAKGVDLQQLKIAKKMKKGGLDSETVELETGWFYDKDRKWKTEISDADVKWKSPQSLNPTLSTGRDMWGRITLPHKRLGDVIDAPTLFHNYPELKQHPMNIRKRLEDDNLGSYSYVDGTIELKSELDQTTMDAINAIEWRMEHGKGSFDDQIQLSSLKRAHPEYETDLEYVKRRRHEDGDRFATKEEMEHVLVEPKAHREMGERPKENNPLGVLLHEIQHAVQHKEDFGQGYNTKELRNKLKEFENLFQQKHADVGARLKEAGVGSLMVDSSTPMRSRSIPSFSEFRPWGQEGAKHIPLNKLKETFMVNGLSANEASALLKDLKEVRRIARKAEKNWSRDWRKDPMEMLTPHQTWGRQLGENEAELTMKSQNWGMEERRLNPRSLRQSSFGLPKTKDSVVNRSVNTDFWQYPFKRKD